MAEPSNLAQLIEDAAGSSVAVDELLRRLKVAASRARIAELEGWVQNELDGYDDASDLPPYRGPFAAHVLGHFSGWFQSQASNVPIGAAAFPEDLREGRLFQVRFFDGVAALEALAAANSELQIPWPADAILYAQMLVDQGKVNFNGHVLNEAHQVISRSTIVGILRTVRDRVLALALRLEQENPHLGEAGAPVASAAVGRDVQIIVNGGQPNIAVASSHVSQSIRLVTPGDRPSLLGHLRGLGVDEDGLNALAEALDEDDADRHAGSPASPGSRVLAWVGRLSTTATTAAGTELAIEAGKAIAHFFG
jgi:AbiTii